jgi:hypothetical protein
MSRTITQERLAALKAEWFANPYWALENTEGFEDHRVELRQFRLDTHARQERERAEQLIRSGPSHEKEDRAYQKDYQIEYSASQVENTP